MSPTEQEIQVSPADHRVYRSITLKNGLKCILIYDSEISVGENTPCCDIERGNFEHATAMHEGEGSSSESDGDSSVREM